MMSHDQIESPGFHVLFTLGPCYCLLLLFSFRQHSLKLNDLLRFIQNVESAVPLDGIQRNTASAPELAPVPVSGMLHAKLNLECLRN